MTDIAGTPHARTEGAFLDLAIDYRDPRTLEPAGRRLRVHTPKQLGKLERAVDAFGFTVPVLLDEAGRVLAGHARVEVARRMKLERIPTIVLGHMSPQQKRAFGLCQVKCTCW